MTCNNRNLVANITAENLYVEVGSVEKKCVDYKGVFSTFLAFSFFLLMSTFAYADVKLECEKYYPNISKVGFYIGQDKEKFVPTMMKGRLDVSKENFSEKSMKGIYSIANPSEGFCFIFAYKQSKPSKAPNAAELFKQYALVIHSTYKLANKLKGKSGVTISTFGLGPQRSVTLSDDEWQDFLEGGPEGVKDYQQEEALKDISVNFPRDAVSFDIFDKRGRRSTFVILDDFNSVDNQYVFEQTRINEPQDGSMRMISKEFQPRAQYADRQKIIVSIVNPTECIREKSECVNSAILGVQFER